MNKTNIDEAKIIEKTLNGDLYHQTLLYNKYKRIVTSYIKERYDLKEDIDDVVSDILIKVFLKLDVYNKKKSNFNTWILNITKNHMIDQWRKKNN